MLLFQGAIAMSDPTEDRKRLVTVVVKLPAGLVEVHDGHIEKRKIHLGHLCAILHTVVESRRHSKGTFHTFLRSRPAERYPDAGTSEVSAAHLEHEGQNG